MEFTVCVGTSIKKTKNLLNRKGVEMAKNARMPPKTASARKLIPINSFKNRFRYGKSSFNPCFYQPSFLATCGAIHYRKSTVFVNHKLNKVLLGEATCFVGLQHVSLVLDNTRALHTQKKILKEKQFSKVWIFNGRYQVRHLFFSKHRLKRILELSLKWLNWVSRHHIKKLEPQQTKNCFKYKYK